MDKLTLYKVLGKNGAEKSASGNPVVLTGMREGQPLKDIKVYGWSKQESTTGAQLLDAVGIINNNTGKGQYDEVVCEGREIKVTATVNDDDTSKYRNYYFSLNTEIVNGKKITASIDEATNDAGEADGTICDISYSVDRETTLWYGFGVGNPVTVDIPEDAVYARCRIKVLESMRDTVRAGTYTTTVTGLMLSIGSTVRPYEPYTGGVPSPNPDYPQEIVSAGMKWSTGKNLLKYPYIRKSGVYKGVNFVVTNGHVRAGGTTTGGTNFEFTTITTPGEYAVKTNGTIAGLVLRVYDMTSKKALSRSEFTVENGHEVLVYLNTGATGVNVDVDTDIVLAKLEDIDIVPYEPYTGGVPALYGDKVNIDVRGKNLFNVEKQYLASLTYQNGVYEAQDNDDMGFMGFKIQLYTNSGLVANSQVSVSRVTSPGKIYFHFTKFGESTRLRFANSGKSREFSLSYPIDDIPDGTKLTFAVNVVDATIGAAKFKEPQLLIGNVETSLYEPYHEPQTLRLDTPTGLPAIPVPTGGNYTDASGQWWIADYVDLARGKYVQRVKKEDVPNNITWSIQKQNSGEYALGYCAAFADGVTTQTTNMDSAWKSNMGKSMGTWKNEFCFGRSGVFWIVPYKNDGNITSDDINEWLVEHPMHVVYPLNEPIERDLTPKEIESYKALKAYAGTTIIENDTECFMTVKSGTDLLRAKKIAMLLGE